jgi:hypothetical protein
MDWQQPAALLVVAMTASMFALARIRRRRQFSLKHDTHCGCGSAGDLGAKQTIRFSARKGARPQVIIKNG